MYAINKKNLIDKLGFLVADQALASNEQIMNEGARKAALKEKLKQSLSHRGTKIISRQTVHYWFEKNSAPSREPAFRFLNDFLENSIDYRQLSGEGKKVYKQIKSYLINNIYSLEKEEVLPKTSDRIFTTSQGNLVIHGRSKADIIEETNDSWSGVYISYRLRLTNDIRSPISREVVRIYRRKKELRYEHWHLRDGTSLQKFEGSLIINNNLLWMIGGSDAHDRLRILFFRRNPTKNQIYRRFRWGLMCSDLSVLSTSDPTCCRILLIKQKNNIDNYKRFTENTVKYLSKSELPKELDDVILRCIETNSTSLSAHGDYLTTTNLNGEKVLDHVLRVDQRTLDLICENT